MGFRDRDFGPRKCTKLPAQIVVMKLKFLLNQKKADLFIAGIVTKNIGNFRFNDSRFPI